MINQSVPQPDAEASQCSIFVCRKPFSILERKHVSASTPPIPNHIAHTSAQRHSTAESAAISYAEAVHYARHYSWIHQTLSSYTLRAIPQSPNTLLPSRRSRTNAYAISAGTLYTALYRSARPSSAASCPNPSMIRCGTLTPRRHPSAPRAVYILLLISSPRLLAPPFAAHSPALPQALAPARRVPLHRHCALLCNRQPLYLP